MLMNSLPLQRQNGVVNGGDYHHYPYLSKKKSKESAYRHAKAESERRKRINSHLSTLRKLFPHLTKKDKPRVLTEAVKQIKELREKVAGQLAQHGPLFLPGESDEVAVAHCSAAAADGGGGGEPTVKATICCEDRPGLNRDLTEAVQSVNGRVVKAEMATVGGRTKVDVVLRWHNNGGGAAVCGGGDLGPLRRALRAVVENRSLGDAMFLCRSLQADKWADLKVDPFVNKSAHLFGPDVRFTN